VTGKLISAPFEDRMLIAWARVQWHFELYQNVPEPPTAEAVARAAAFEWTTGEPGDVDALFDTLRGAAESAYPPPDV
jgi:hypothetical protein